MFEENLVKFKISLLRKAPFYSDVISLIEIKKDKSIPTAATDGYRILYNNKFMNSLNEGQQNYVMMHELMHIILLHPQRAIDMAKIDPKLANIAEDFIVNNLVDGMVREFNNANIPLERPEEGCFADVGWGMTLENLFSMLIKDNEDYIGNSGKKTITIRDKYGSFGNQTKEVNEKKFNIDVQIQPSGDVQIQPSGASKIDSLSNGKMEAIAGSIRELVGRHTRDKSGSIGIPRAIIECVKPKPLDWRVYFKNMLEEVVSEESSYSTPERKYLHMDMILPGHCMSEDAIGNVWAFVDCSGSIGREQLNQFFSQLEKLMREFSCNINIAFWDTAIWDAYKDVPVKKLYDCMPNHSGGTDINCVYKWIEENKVEKSIDVMLVLTDGYFGTVRQSRLLNKLKRKTVVVLYGCDNVTDNIKAVGKIAELKG